MKDIERKLKAMEMDQCCGETKREKFWDECSIEEKIERMRQQVKSLQRSMDQFSDAVARMNNHQHDVGGRMLVPFEMYPNHGLNMTVGYAGHNNEYF